MTVRANSVTRLTGIAEDGGEFAFDNCESMFDSMLAELRALAPDFALTPVENVVMHPAQPRFTTLSCEWTREGQPYQISVDVPDGADMWAAKIKTLDVCRQLMERGKR